MIIFYAYLAALAVAVLLAFATAKVKRDARLLRCVLALLANWLVGMAVSYSGWTDAWPVNIPLDAATAYVVLHKPAGRWQAALGVTYCIQILMHIGFALVTILTKEADPMAYYNQLTGVAFLQLALLGSWSIGLWGTYPRGSNRGSPVAGEGGSGVAEAR